MGSSKKQPAKVAIPERVRRAFAAATGDLVPRGRLPSSMTEDQARRAVLAFAGLQLERFAVAGEGMLRILDQEEDDWTDEPEPAPFGEAPAGVELPREIVAGSASPEDVAKLLREQDLDTCRRFAIELLRWVAAKAIGGVDLGDDVSELPIEELARDLEMMEHDAIGLVGELFDASRKPKLIKPERHQADEDAADDAGNTGTDEPEDGGDDAEP